MKNIKIDKNEWNTRLKFALIKLNPNLAIDNAKVVSGTIIAEDKLKIIISFTFNTYELDGLIYVIDESINTKLHCFNTLLGP